MSDISTSFWPYEQRFELVTTGDLWDLPDSTWPELAAVASSPIIKEGRSPQCRHFILSLSSLFVFRHRALLLTCSRNGVLKAANDLIGQSEQLAPMYATLEVRHPLGRFSSRRDEIPREAGLPPLTATSEGAVLHEWRFEGTFAPTTSTLVILMHDLAGICSLRTATGVVRSKFRDFLTVSHQFDENGFSFNSISGESYITMHYTQGVYASVECSLTDWEPLDDFLGELLSLCRPGVVAPLWHGRPITSLGMVPDEEPYSSQG